MSQKYSTPAEAGERLGVSVQTLRRWARQGKIPSVKTPSGQNRYDVGAYLQAAKSSGNKKKGKKGDSSQPAKTIAKRKLDDSPFLMSATGSWRGRGYPYFRGGDPFHDPRELMPVEPGGRVPTDKLISFAGTMPVRKAISRIANGLAGMDWTIFPRDKEEMTDAEQKFARKIEFSISKPNKSRTGTHLGFLETFVSDLIVFNYTAVERREAKNDDERSFYVWPAITKNIREDPAWEEDSGDFRYYDTGGSSNPDDWVGFLDSELFVAQKNHSSWDYIPPSTLEIAYNMIEIWLGITNQQRRVTSNAYKQTVLNLGQKVSQAELDAFREYWDTDVVNSGKVAIFSGSDMNTINLGAQNDEELYIKYVEYLLKIIAVSFGLTHRDMGITEHDNRATAGVAADTTFADAILPFARLFEQTINNEILYYYESTRDFFFEFTNKEPRNENEEASRAQGLFEKKIITRNEARSLVGFDRIDGGDVFFDGSKPGEEPQPEQPQLTPQQMQQLQQVPSQDAGAAGLETEGDPKAGGDPPKGEKNKIEKFEKNGKKPEEPQKKK